MELRKQVYGNQNWISSLKCRVWLEYKVFDCIIGIQQCILHRSIYGSKLDNSSQLNAVGQQCKCWFMVLWEKSQYLPSILPCHFASVLCTLMYAMYESRYHWRRLWSPSLSTWTQQSCQCKYNILTVLHLHDRYSVTLLHWPISLIQISSIVAEKSNQKLVFFSFSIFEFIVIRSLPQMWSLKVPSVRSREVSQFSLGKGRFSCM